MFLFWFGLVCRCGYSKLHVVFTIVCETSNELWNMEYLHLLDLRVMMTHSGQMLASDRTSTAHSEEEQKCTQTTYHLNIMVHEYCNSTVPWYFYLLLSEKYFSLVRDPGDRGHLSSPSYPDKECLEELKWWNRSETIQLCFSFDINETEDREI